MTRNKSYFPATDNNGEHYEPPWRPTDEPVCPDEENSSPAYRKYLDDLERINREHEERRLDREFHKDLHPYPDSEIHEK